MGVAGGVTEGVAVAAVGAGAEGGAVGVTATSTVGVTAAELSRVGTTVTTGELFVVL